jgi:hypothetical protein
VLAAHFPLAILKIRECLEHLRIALTDGLEILANSQRCIEDFRVARLWPRRLVDAAACVANPFAGVKKRTAPTLVGVDKRPGIQAPRHIHNGILLNERKVQKHVLL